MSRNFKDIEMLEFFRKIDADAFISVKLDLEHNIISAIQRDTYTGSIINSDQEINRKLTQDGVNNFLEKLEPMDILNWPYSILASEYHEKIPMASYSIDDKPHMLMRNPHNPNHMRQLHAMFEKLLGTEIGDASDHSDFDSAWDYSQLDFLSYQVRNLDGSYANIYIRPKSYSLEIKFFDDAQVYKSRTEKEVRRSYMRKFLETLKELDMYNFPVELNGEAHTDYFPNLVYAINFFIYTVQSNVIPAKKFITLHKAIERLAGDTFGSYRWYKDM